VITVTATDRQLIWVKVVCFTLEIVIVVAVNVIVVAIIAMTTTTTTTTTTTRHLKGVTFLFYCINV
jgi:2',3'-cyclic-nucleotide 2'-phosphodiesterase (5'-nucleotidase family)